MMLCEAKAIIDERLDETLMCDYRHLIPEYFEALEIASKSIEAQIRLTELLNEWWCDVSENDEFSAKLSYGMLKQFSIFAEFDEDGMLIEDDEQGVD